MFRRHRTVLALAALLGAGPARATTLYVAPTGNDDAAGSEAAPLASLARAQTLAVPGDTVYLRGGTYTFDRAATTCKSGTDTISGVVLDKDGSEGKPIRYFAFAGEKPVLDFDGIRDSCRIKGILVSADYVHLRGLELRGVRQNNDLNHESWGLWNQGSHNVFEQLDVHHIMGAGIFIQRGAENLVLNCDSHHNLDEHTSNGAGESADGFGCHVGAGDAGNVFRGCRAWWNADDGYDFINADAPCTVEHSWAWLNGYVPDTMDGIGNGNGFKAGGYGADPAEFPANPAQHSVRFCLAVANKAAGFYANHHPTLIDFFNNTSYANHPDFNMLGMSAAGEAITVGRYRNNVALAGTLFSNRMSADDEHNSWTLAGLTFDAADFLSVATMGLDAPRGPDGALPDVASFQLAEGSSLIDAGVDVGLAFAGQAPDLGAFELGLEKAPMGGMDAGGSGGVAGTSAGGVPAGGAPSEPPGGMNAASTGSSGAPATNGGGAPPASGGAPAVDLAPSSAARAPGCACDAAGTEKSSISWLGALLALGLAVRRRASAAG
jgi:MYXO-CTERM domain-containing protein